MPTNGVKLGIRGNRPKLRGPARPASVAQPPAPVPPSTPAALPRVLFLCVGNSCRSQMAESFARRYGAGVLEARSAGLSPAVAVSPLTRQILAEKNLEIGDAFPKGIDLLRNERFDLVVNMAGTPFRMPGARVLEWRVEDPIGKTDEFYRKVANELEGLVMRLILEMRGGVASAQSRGAR